MKATVFPSSHKDIFFIAFQRERGRDRQTDRDVNVREKHRLPPIGSLTGDGTYNTSVYRTTLHTAEPHWPATSHASRQGRHEKPVVRQNISHKTGMTREKEMP